MGLDLGTLSITIGVDDQGVASKLDGTKKKLDQVKTSADQVDKIKAAPTVDEKGIDKASASTKKLGTDLDQVGSKRVKPSVDSSEVVKASDAVRSLADGLGGAAEKAVKFSASAAAVAGIGTIGTAFAKGFQRLDALDQAEAKLEALGNSGRDVQIVMDNALASVKGTSFGIGDAASTAAVLVGAGVKPGEELDRTLKLVADSAAIAGVSFGEMGSIWGKVASSTVLSGEEMAQISDRSIGLQVALAEQMGVTALEAKKAVSEGKVSFEDFEQAMESLVGGGAVRMGQTVSGAMDNFGAALGRGGAAILESGFEQLPNILGAATSTVDDLTASITPLAAEFGAKLAPHLENFASNLGPNVAAGMSMIADGFSTVAPLVSNVASGLSSIPFPLVAGGLTALVAQNKGWIDSLNSGSGKIKQYGTQLQDGLVGALTRAGTAYDSGSAKLNIIAQNHRTAAAAAKAQSLQTTDAFASMDRMGSSTARSLVASTTQIGAGLSGMASGGLSLAKSGMDGVKSAAGGLMGALGGPWGLAITGATALIGYLASEHFKAKQAEEEHKAAQQELAGTLDATTGAVTSQTAALVEKRLAEDGTLETARELGLSSEIITQAALGNEDAMARVKLATDQSNLSFIESSEWWGKYGQAMQDAGYTAGDVLDTLERRQSGGPVTQLDRDIQTLMGTMQGGTGDMHRFSDEFEKTQEGIIALGGSVTETNNQIAAGTLAEAQDNLVNYQDQVKRTADVLKLLGESEIDIVSDKTIKIEANEETRKTKALLDEIEGVTTETMNGEIFIDFEDGLVVSELLESLGVKLKELDGYIVLDTTDFEEAQRMADILGANVQTLPSGELALDYADIPEAQALLEGLGILSNVDGRVSIDESILLSADKKVNDLRANVEKGMEGELEVKDNIDDIHRRLRNLNGTHTQSYHTVVSGTQTSTNGRTDMGRQVVNADGNVLEFYANGGTRENHVAQIAPAGAWRVWAEEETGGEAYIPLANSKRARSEKILEEVARRFGKTIIDQDVIAFENGGFTERALSTLSPYNNGRYVMGGFSPTVTDCSGAVAMGVNAYLGLDPFDSRMSTVNEGQWLANKGFQRGKGGPNDLVVGWWDQGGGANGHTAMRFPDGTYLESGGNTGQGLTIGGKAGPLEGRGFTDFMFLPGTGGEDPNASYDDGSPMSAMSGGGGGVSGFGSWSSGGQASGFTRSFNPMQTQAGESGVGSTLGLVGDPAPGITSAFTKQLNAQLGSAIAGSGLREAANKAGLGVELDQIEKGISNAIEGSKIWLSVNPETIEAFNALGMAQEDRQEAAFNVARAEEALEEARKNSGQSAEDYAEKVEEAEKAVARAREDGSEKIADAEKNLAKAREDEKADAEKIEAAQKRLNEAMADAPEKVEKAEKALNKLLQDGPDAATDAANSVADAEQKLEQARIDEERSIAALEQAQRSYNEALRMAPIKAVQSLLTKVADGFTALGDVLDRLSSQAERLRALSAQRLDAEVALASAQMDVHRAEVAAAQASRDSSYGRWQDTMALQDAEWNLAMSRIDAQNAVAQSGQAANAVQLQNAMLILNVAQMEAAVAQQKAENDLNEFERTYLKAQANADLEYAEYIATAQAMQLTAAIDAAAEAQAGLYGIHTTGMSALGSVVKGIGSIVAGVVKFIAGLAAMGAAIAQFAAGPAAWPTAIASAAAAIPLLTGGINDAVSGATTIGANWNDAKTEWGQASTKEKFATVLSVGGTALSGVAAGWAGMNGGSMDDVLGIQQGVQDLGNTGLSILEAQREARLQAAERRAEQKRAEIDLEVKKAERDKILADLERSKEGSAEREKLQSTLDEATKAFLESQQKYNQTSDLASRSPQGSSGGSSQSDRTSFFQVGGAGWESMNTTNRVLGADGGFAGIGAGVLGSHESSWGLAEGGITGVSSGGLIPELPEVVVKQADAATTTAEATVGMWGEMSYVSSMLDRIFGRMTGSGSGSRTVFSAPVTIQSNSSFGDFDADLRKALSR